MVTQKQKSPIWDNYFIFAAATIGLKELNFQPKPKE